MRVVTGSLGFILLTIVLADAIKTVVVARHTRTLPSITRRFYRASWAPYAAIGQLIRSESRREHFLGLYGPLSLLMLLSFWATSVIAAFGMLQWSAGLRFDGAPSSAVNSVYFSAASFFTLGSTEPQNLPSKYLMVLEAGLGFSFLGLVIGYLPVLYQSFSNRELRILLLDARAGSPPSAAALLLRRGSSADKLEQRLADWEEWALDLLQAHLSYPMLAYYRSQHASQSWLAALTVVVDVSALIAVSAEGDLRRQAEFTFAAGRHSLVHTASVFRKRPCPPQLDRLSAADFARLCGALSSGSTLLRPDCIRAPELAELRAMYEPYANSLSAYFRMALPLWLPSEGTLDNWQISWWATR